MGIWVDTKTSLRPLLTKAAGRHSRRRAVPLFAGFAASALLSCSHTLTCQTVPPGADIALLDDSGKTILNAGKSPASVPLPAGNDPLIIEVTRAGYLAKQVLVPRTTGADVAITVRLLEMDRAWFATELRSQFPQVLDSALTDLVRLQSSIGAGRERDVQQLYDKMKADYAGVSVFHSLMGNHSFLKGDKNKAMEFYQRARQLNPNNEEAQSMINLIQNRGP